MYIPTADESISPDEIPVSSDYLGYGFFAIFVLFISAVSLYLRCRYPCLTLQEMNKKEEGLDNAYTRTLKAEDLLLYGSKLEDIARRRFKYVLKKRASQIRMKSLQLDVTSSSIWRIYLGFHPKLVSDIVNWNKDTETLERDILHIIEFVAQRRLDSNVQLTTPADPVTAPNISKDTSCRESRSCTFCGMLRNICRPHRRPFDEDRTCTKPDSQ
ncbi:hypothetical protein WG66_009628 [Moniliophthora roreri]|nr:hypothetical protein WG66_009628 [Moniliophthora roreri]